MAHKTSPELIAEIEMLRLRGMTVRQICANLSVSERTVCKYTAKLVEPSIVSGASRQGRQPIPDLEPRVAALLASGNTIRSTAKTLGVSESTVERAKAGKQLPRVSPSFAGALLRRLSDSDWHVPETVSERIGYLRLWQKGMCVRKTEPKAMYQRLHGVDATDTITDLNSVKVRRHKAKRGELLAGALESVSETALLSDWKRKIGINQALRDLRAESRRRRSDVGNPTFAP